MKKILSSVLILMFLVVGCGKEEVVEVETPIVEEVEVLNPYFVGEEAESNNYIVDFGFYYDYKKYPTNLDINKIESTEFGDVYQILIVGEFDDVNESLKDLGYYLVTEDLIVKLNSKEVINDISKEVTLDNAEEIGDVVCSETDMTYSRSQGSGEVEYTITNDTNEGKVKFTKHANYEAGAYVEFTWKKGVGLVQYEFGTDAEGYVKKLSLFDDEKKIIEKTTSYSGTIDDIPIHMELNYYDTGLVDGSYYYDKFKEDIALVGTRENDVLNLKTKNGSENIVGDIHSSYVTGKWNSNGKTLDLYLINENNDEYSSNNNVFLAYEDYVYYSNPVGIYRLDLETRSLDRIIDVEWAKELNIYNDKLYYFEGERAYKAEMDGSSIEEIDLGLNIDKEQYYIENFEIYKGRIYVFVEPMGQKEEGLGYMLSTDMQGEDIKRVEYQPMYAPDYPNMLLDYYECFIYNDNIFFENDDIMGLDYGYGYKMNLDGSNVVVYYQPIFTFSGAGGEYLFSGWGGQSEDIFKDSIENQTNVKSVELYHEEEMPELYNSALEGFANNDKYIATGLNAKEEGYYTFKVFDYDGNILLDEDLPRPEISEEAFEYYDIGVIGDYVYYYMYAHGEMDKLLRINIKDMSIEEFDFVE